MSFLRRLALKSVMAAKKESVAKCAGPLQHGVGRQDGANTMIKTIQYLAELTTHESLLLLISKQPSKTCLGEPCCTASSKNDADLAAVFSKSYTGATEHRMHYDSANTKNSPTAGWIRVVLSTCGFSAAIDPVLRCPCWQTFAGNMTQAQSFFAYLGRLVLVDQTSVLAANICSHHSSNQISQPRASALQNTDLEGLVSGSNSC